MEEEQDLGGSSCTSPARQDSSSRMKRKSDGREMRKDTERRRESRSRYSSPPRRRDESRDRRRGYDRYLSHRSRAPYSRSPNRSPRRRSRTPPRRTPLRSSRHRDRSRSPRYERRRRYRSRSRSPSPSERPRPRNKRTPSGWTHHEEGKPTVDMSSTISEDQRDAIERAQLFAQHHNRLSPRIGKSPDTLSSEPTEESLQCRVYVGSLPYEGIGEEQIRQAFSAFGPILHVTMNTDPSTGRSRGFCFIDYESPESAQSAIPVMNGQVLGGRSIKVGPAAAPGNRKSNVSMPGVPSVVTSIGLPVGQMNYVPVPGSRIYVGSIQYDLTSADLIPYFAKCGPVRSCQLVPNPETGKHRGFGFIEFETAEAATQALQVMNGYPLGGRSIKVGPASHPVSSIPPPAVFPVAGTASLVESPIVRVRNMATEEDLSDASELRSDVREECERYGPVDRVIVHQDPRLQEAIIYVIFKSTESATQAAMALHNRWYAKRQIIATRLASLPEGLEQ